MFLPRPSFSLGSKRVAVTGHRRTQNHPPVLDYAATNPWNNPNLLPTYRYNKVWS